MRVMMMTIGWALMLAGAALLGAGVFAGAPSEPNSAFSAAQQVAMQSWSLTRAFEGLALGFTALIAAFAALILARMTPPGEG